MAFTQNELYHMETFVAASAIQFGFPVQQSASQDAAVLPASNASVGVAPVYGIAAASAPTANTNIPIQTGGIGKAFAAASLGPGAFVMANIAASPGFVPVGPSGAASALGALGIQYPRYAAGKSVTGAVAGGIFSIKIAPGEVF